MNGSQKSPATKKMPADLRRWFNEHKISEIEAVIPDITGIAKGKIVPAKKYQEDVGIRLPHSVFGQTVNGEYPDTDTIFSDSDGDIFLRPDANTVRHVPATDDPTAVIIHDCFHANGKAVEIAPRQVLRRVLNLYQDKGWTPIVAPEVEFYLVQKNTDSDYPLIPPIGRSGRQEIGRQSFSIDAVNEFEPLFDDLYQYCEIQEIDIETLIHESGAAQMEINLSHGEAMELSDQVFLFKRALREVAQKHNIYGTFMAQPMENQPGSALHIHQSIIDTKTKLNIFSTLEGKESDLFKWYLGGLQKYLPVVTAIMAPNVNSYRRLSPNEFSSPINIEWGYDNRTAGLRIPISDHESRRIENRICGADVNPYLATASTLLCGYLGMIERINPSDPVEDDACSRETTLPKTLREAVEELELCKHIHQYLGEDFVQLYCTIKRHEYSIFLNVISAWEREHLLLNV